MADHLEGRTFASPIFASCDPNVPLVASDQIEVFLASDDGVPKEFTLTVAAVSDDNRTIYWECDATNNFLRSADVMAVDDAYSCKCATIVSHICWSVIDSTNAEADDVIVSGTVEVNGVESPLTGGPYDPTVSGDDVRLEDDLNALLYVYGHATVVVSEAHFVIHITGITSEIVVTLVDGADVDMVPYDCSDEAHDTLEEEPEP